MEEIYGYFKDLIVINFHHHYDIAETDPANVDSILVTRHCLLKPFILIFEKLRIEVSDPPRQNLKDIAVLLFNRV